MPPRLSKLLLLGPEEKKRVREWSLGGGPVAHTVLSKDNAISDV